MATDTYSVSLSGGPQTQEAHDAQSAATEGGPYTLAEVIALCVDLGCDAKLLDEPGFTKGWVHADGTYTLN